MHPLVYIDASKVIGVGCEDGCITQYYSDALNLFVEMPKRGYIRARSGNPYTEFWLSFGYA